MASGERPFNHLDRSVHSKLKIGNGEDIFVKGREIVAIESNRGTKLIDEVIYMPEIDQNILSVGQLLEKKFKLLFMD